jgi:methylmalonyl-CoA mutase
MSHPDTTLPTFDEFQQATDTQWREAAEESLKGAPFEKKLMTPTPEGITLKPVYTAADTADLPEAWPGLPAFTRGSGAAPKPPLVAQEIPVGDPAEFHEALMADLMAGQNALAVQLDTAGRMGLDPSEAETSEVAVCGLSLACLEDARAAFRDVDPKAVGLLLWAGPSALPVLGLLNAHASDWHGAVAGDPLTEYAREGRLPMALEDACDEMAACVRWSRSMGGTIRTVGVGANLWADAGADAVGEIAFGLATAAAYLRALEARELPVSETCGQFLFTVSLGSKVLLQIAKVRALRRLWAAVLDACGAAPEAAVIHGRGSVFNKTWLDPHTNMLRATAEGFVGMIAGVDSMHVAAFDEAARTPAGFSRRIARNMHAILSEECEFSATADPSGGSWCIETLTAEIADKAWELFQKIEAMGGMAAALEKGFPQETTAASAEERVKAIATRREPAIGVNLFPNPAEKPLEADPPDHQAAHARRAAFIEGLRPHTPPTVERSVESVAAAFTAGATLGQVREALPRPGTPPPAIARPRIFRLAEGYEALRANAIRHANSGGKTPSAWLANFGPPKQHKARADFAAGFLAAGGFEIRQGPGASSVEEAAKAALESGCKVIVLCSTDDTYPELVAPFVAAVRAKKPKRQILLAGLPSDHVEAFRAAGIDDFIHLRANCLEFNETLQHKLGIAH